MGSHSLHRGTKNRHSSGFTLIEPRQLSRFASIVDKAERKAAQERLRQEVRALILASGKTYKAISQAHNISTATLSCVMSGSTTGIPSIDTLDRIRTSLSP